MTTTTAQRISLQSPEYLCCSVPHLLGFHPVDSAVLLWLVDGVIELAQRIDLPASNHDREPWLDAVWGHQAAPRADEVLVVLVPPATVPPATVPPATDPQVALTEVGAWIADIARRRGPVLRDVILLDHDRWRSLLCTDLTCCPPAGNPIGAMVRAEVAAEFAYVGSAPLPARANVLAAFDTDPMGVAEVMATGVLARGPVQACRLESWRDRMLANLLDWVAQPNAADPAHRCAHLLRALRDIRVRDTLLWEIGHVDRESLMRAQGQLARLMRMAPPGDVAPVATCVGLCAWLLGDGVRAATAAQLALTDDPSYRMALILQASVQAGLPPSEWQRAMAGLSREICRHGDQGGDADPEDDAL